MLAIGVTFLITCAVCFVVFKRLLKVALMQQQKESQEEYERKLSENKKISEERFQKLISEMNHQREVPTLARIAGLSWITGSDHGEIIEQLEKLQKERGYILTHIISRLYLIKTQGIKFLEDSVREFLKNKREVLKRYDADQGIKDG